MIKNHEFTPYNTYMKHLCEVCQRKQILYFFILFWSISCKKEALTTQNSATKISKITIKNSSFKDYNGREQSVYEYDKSGLFTVQTVTALNSTDKYLIKAVYSNNQLTKLLYEQKDARGTITNTLLSDMSYDTKGRLVKNISDNGKRIETFEYSGTATQPSKVKVIDNGKEFYTADLKWLNENLIEMRYSVSNKPYELVSYKYDKSPNIFRFISAQYYIHSTHSTAQFFSKNNISEISVTSLNGIAISGKAKLKHQYFYDESGKATRWLREDEFDNNFRGVEIEYL